MRKILVLSFFVIKAADLLSRSTVKAIHSSCRILSFEIFDWREKRKKGKAIGDERGGKIPHNNTASPRDNDD